MTPTECPKSQKRVYSDGRRRQRQHAARAERSAAELNILLPDRPGLATILARYSGRTPAGLIRDLCARYDVHDERLVRAALAILRSRPEAVAADPAAQIDAVERIIARDAARVDTGLGTPEEPADGTPDAFGRPDGRGER